MGELSSHAFGQDDAGRRSPIGAKATRQTSLDLPPSIPLDEWRRIGKQIFVVADSSAWWLGDWLIYGQSAYPDRYRRAIEETSLDYQTLRNYAWIARRFSPARRRAALSFQHHAEVASLQEREQDYWLERAERLGWSRNFLRNRLKGPRQMEEAKEETIAKMSIQVSVPKDRRQCWAQAASSMEQDLETWVMSILDDAAATVLDE